jgi:hypothetical protein
MTLRSSHRILRASKKTLQVDSQPAGVEFPALMAMSFGERLRAVFELILHASKHWVRPKFEVTS